MQYKNSKICKGFGSEYKPCEHIDICKICTNYAFDTRQGNNNELYRVFGFAIACKRDNPDFVPLKASEMDDFDKNNSEHVQRLKEFIRLGIFEEECL